jgi:hypothetical protein
MRAPRSRVTAGASLEYRFGPTREPQTRRQAFALPKDASRKELAFGFVDDLADESTGETVPPAATLGKLARVNIDRRATRLVLCNPAGEDSAAPNHQGGVEPGEYAGTVLVGSPWSEPRARAALPVVVSVSDSRQWIALLPVLAGVLAGIAVRAPGDLAQAPGKPGGGGPDASAYVYSPRFLVMVAGGFLGGLLVFDPLFASKAAATVDPFDTLIPLAGAAFASTLMAKTLADLYNPTKAERKAGLYGIPRGRQRLRRGLRSCDGCINDLLVGIRSTRGAPLAGARESFQSRQDNSFRAGPSVSPMLEMSDHCLAASWAPEMLADLAAHVSAQRGPGRHDLFNELGASIHQRHDVLDVRRTQVVPLPPPGECFELHCEQIRRRRTPNRCLRRQRALHRFR